MGCSEAWGPLFGATSLSYSANSRTKPFQFHPLRGTVQSYSPAKPQSALRSAA